jgi:anti-sigma B factor antagonist
MVEITHEDNRVVVRLAGDLDIATAPATGERLAEVPGLGFQDVCVDLGHVDFMDSQGLKLLVQLRKSIAEVGGTLEVWNATGQVRDVIGLSGLDRLLAGGIGRTDPDSAT